jgi:EAL domain-containing protein (putative c-di-GMP-specific phosphodiesterase class I)/GGDEF domain-containing protein
VKPTVDDAFRQQVLTFGQRYDTHTGLLNYVTFQEELIALLREGPPGQEIALVWIELLNLRREFSLRGWSASEAMVRRVAEILRSAVGAGGLLARFSGRCFVVAIPVAGERRGESRRIHTLMDALSLLRRHDSEQNPELAAGVAFYPSDTESAEDLVRFASLAATHANYVHSPLVMPFQARMNNLIMRDHRLQVEMDKGLDQGQFSLVYQPKLDLRTGAVLGAEALIRWYHPELGHVTPSEFIPVAERSGLIHRIFDYTLRGALNDARKWRDLGLSVPIISVNASAPNIRRNDIARTVHNILMELPIEPVVLELELTESVLFDDEELFITRVGELSEIGVRIAIDDFGTRYTGFNVLKQVSLDAMKIDKCFIRGIDRSQDMRSLCQTIVAMARNLKMRTVAEGIEEPGELEVMRDIGCDAGQGYLFQRPVPTAEFVAFLRDWPQRMRTFGYMDCDPLNSLPGVA